MRTFSEYMHIEHKVFGTYKASMFKVTQIFIKLEVNINAKLKVSRRLRLTIK